MNIPIRQSHGVTILDPQGKIAIGVGNVAVREAVQSALEAGSRRKFVNLSGVPAVDSVGIGELLSVHTTVTDHGGQLKLATPPTRVRELIPGYRSLSRTWRLEP